MTDGGVSPSFERYVTGLPGGLEAFPALVTKGSVVRSLLDGQPDDVLRGLPAPVRALAVDPPIDSDWIPETHFAALLHALAEARHLEGRAFRAWIRLANRSLFASPLYRILMAVVSPEALLRHVDRRWNNFHRGSTAALDGFADDGARVTLRFPAGVFDGLVLEAFAEAFAAALEAAQAKAPVVVVEAAGPGFARYLARW